MRTVCCLLVMGCVDSAPPVDPPPPAPATTMADQVAGTVQDEGGTAVAATVYLLVGSVERSATTDASGAFVFSEPGEGLATLQVSPTDDALAPLEAPLLLDPSGGSLDLVVPALVRQPLPDIATPLAIGDGVELTVGHDVLAGTLGASDIGAAAFDPASLQGWAPLGAEAVAAWAIAPLASPSEPLDVTLSVDVPDGAYELWTSGFDGWMDAGVVDVVGGESIAPVAIERLGTWVLISP